MCKNTTLVNYTLDTQTFLETDQKFKISLKASYIKNIMQIKYKELRSKDIISF